MPYDRKGVYKQMIEVSVAGASEVTKGVKYKKAGHRLSCARLCRSWQGV